MLVRQDKLLDALDVKQASRTLAVLQRYTSLQPKVERAVLSYLKWPVLRQLDWVEYYDGTGSNDLVLRQPYVTQVTNVWLDQTGAAGQGPSAFSAAPLIVGQDYMARQEGGLCKSGLLRRLTNSVYWFPSDLVWYRGAGGLGYRRPQMWPAGYGNIKVQCDWGFAMDYQVTATSWAGGALTVTTALRHGLVQGQDVTLAVADPEALEGDYQVASVVSPTVFTVPMDADPGALVSCRMDAVPQDIQLAVITATGIIRNTVKYGWPMTSESLKDYSYSLSVVREPEFGGVRELLSQYRDVSVGIMI